MSNRKTKVTRIAEKLTRIEGKCDRLIADVRRLERLMEPRRDEIDEVIDHLHRTALRMRAQSVREFDEMRKFVSR